MNEFLDFQGVVSLYENGHLKWTRHNKITYQGRAFLLKSLAHSVSVNRTSGNNFLNRADVNAYLCGVAFGNGGHMEGSVLNKNTSYSDRGLFNPVPIRQLNNTQMTERNPVLEEEFQNYIAFADTGSNKDCYIDNSDLSYDLRTSININERNLLYFKKIASVTSVNTMKMEDDMHNFKFKSSFATFNIKISQDDFKYFTDQNVHSIDELGLYLGSIQYDLGKIQAGIASINAGEENPNNQIDPDKFDPRLYCQDGQDMLYKKPEYEAKVHNCSYFLKGSIPIMFSHVTFPAEDIVEPKDLTFKYTIYV